MGQPSRREPLSGGSRHVHQQMPSGGFLYRHLYAPSNTKSITAPVGHHIQPQAQHVRIVHPRSATSPPPTRSPSPESGRRSISPLDYVDTPSAPRPPQVPIGGAHAGVLAGSSRQEVRTTPMTSTPAHQLSPSPLPPPISQPAPPAALHLYRGAFPVQEVAMVSPFYRQPITVTVIEDRGLKSSPSTVDDDLWMMDSESHLPKDWLMSVREQFPDHVVRTKEDKKIKIMSWEWVGPLPLRCSATALILF